MPSANPYQPPSHDQASDATFEPEFGFVHPCGVDPADAIFFEGAASADQIRKLINYPVVVWFAFAIIWIGCASVAILLLWVASLGETLAALELCFAIGVIASIAALLTIFIAWLANPRRHTRYLIGKDARLTNWKRGCICDTGIYVADQESTTHGRLSWQYFSVAANAKTGILLKSRPPIEQYIAIPTEHLVGDGDRLRYRLFDWANSPAALPEGSPYRESDVSYPVTNLQTPDSICFDIVRYMIDPADWKHQYRWRRRLNWAFNIGFVVMLLWQYRNFAVPLVVLCMIYAIFVQFGKGIDVQPMLPTMNVWGVFNSEGVKASWLNRDRSVAWNDLASRGEISPIARWLDDIFVLNLDPQISLQFERSDLDADQWTQLEQWLTNHSIKIQ